MRPERYAGTRSGRGASLFLVLGPLDFVLKENFKGFFFFFKQGSDLDFKR